MSFTFREDIATADVAVEVNAKTLNQLFTDAGMAVAEQSANPKTVKPKIKKEVTLKETILEKLFFNFIEELIFIKDSDAMVFNKFKVDVKQKTKEGKKEYALHAVVYGDKINQKTQELHTDVKAITLHLFEIKKAQKGWKAFFILDI